MLKSNIRDLGDVGVDAYPELDMDLLALERLLVADVPNPLIGLRTGVTFGGSFIGVRKGGYGGRG